uniref:Uncharacterized protein n=1 Tax=Avena sativa TaxID=4498 RepID=A0ACD5YDU2_AVESA
MTGSTPTHHPQPIAGEAEKEGRGGEGRRPPSQIQRRSPASHPAARLQTAARGAPGADPRCPPHQRRGLGRQAPQGTAREGGRGGGGTEEGVAAARARVSPPWSPRREAGYPPQWHDFQALVYGRPPGFLQLRPEDWHWRPLQQPPFDFPDHQKDPSEYKPAELANPHAISSYTVVGDSRIWISTVADGTYSYDTASGVWSKATPAVLPFRGRAQYVPEHGLWFGFSSEDELQLCAIDLSVARPVPRKVWEDPPPPESCSLAASYLLPMGSGKFCVARVFERAELPPPGYTKAQRFAVLSGVEVFRAAGIESLQIIEHKSRCYRLGNDEVKLL